MKIDELTLDGFLTYYHTTTIKFDKHNFIIGPNGAGKTTIRNALEWLLTGRTRMTKGSQIAEKYLINDDPNIDKATVSAYFRNQDYWAERDITESRSSRLTSKFQGKEIPGGPKSPTKTESQEALMDGLNINPDLVHYLLDGKDFIELSTSERAEEFATLFGANSTSKAEKEIDFDDLDEKTETVLQNVIDEKDDIEDANDMLVEKRREIKREKKRKNTKLSEINSEVPSSVEFFGDEHPGKYAINNVEEFEKTLEEKKEELASIKGKFSVMGKSLEEFEEEIEGLEDKIDDLPDLNKMEDKLSSFKAQIQSLKNRIDRAETGQTTCVYDSSCECPVDEDDVEDFKKKALAKIDEFSEKKDALSQNIAKAKEINKKIDKLKNKKESAISEEKLEEMKELEKRVDEAKTEYKNIKEIKDNQDVVTELEQGIEDCKDKIKSVNDAIEELENARESILNKSLSDYRDHLETASDIFGQKFKLTDDMDVLMNGRPYYALSESEKLRTQYVNQVALALVTDANFFALDEVNTLFGNNRLKLLKLLKYYDNDIDFSLIIMSSSVDEAPLDNSKLIKL